MTFASLLSICATEPVISAGLLLAGKIDKHDVHRQLVRWCKTGKLIQLRRGLYVLATPFQKTAPHPFVIANALQMGSYVSCQSALAFYDLIPEHVPAITSVSPGRPSVWSTPFGQFSTRHIHPRLAYGYSSIEIAAGQRAFIATPAKAILDLVHLEPRADDPGFLGELRFQNLNQLDVGELLALARQSNSPKLERAARHVSLLARQETEEYQSL